MSPTEITGHHDGAGLRVGIAVARFNEYVTRELLQGAIERLAELGVDDDNVTVAWVPGSFELATAARDMISANGGSMDAVICLGAVIKGETAHFEHVAQGATDGITRVGADTGKPIVFGVLTTYTTDQAMIRADRNAQNLGAEYADTAVEMANLHKALTDL